jgi:hypothetical protein
MLPQIFESCRSVLILWNNLADNGFSIINSLSE